MDVGMAGSLLRGLHFHVSSLPNMVFFSQINDFLDDEITEFATNLLVRTGKIVAAAASALVTVWIVYEGYRIVTGRSREPMMGLVNNSLRAVLIAGIALGAAATTGSTYHALTEGVSGAVRWTITGHNDDGTYADIDKTLAIMQVALEVIDSVDSGGDVITEQTKDRAMTMASVGLGGPAIMAATALLLNKIAMALILGLGPIFILCLLFEQTKPLFSKWLYYGIGTIFSMAFLTVMVTLAMDMVIAVGIAFWLPSAWGAGSTESLTSMAMQQGGMGLILTMLIFSAPPMAAAFFHGLMGSVTAYSAFSEQRVPIAMMANPAGGAPATAMQGSPAITQIPMASAAFQNHGAQQNSLAGNPDRRRQTMDG